MTAFDSKVALITGAAAGIGLAVARKLAEGGARVILVDVSEEVEAAAQTLRDAGYQATSATLDVSASADVAALIAGIVSEHGKLDIAVNNAGIDPEVTLEASWDEAFLDRILAVNLKGVFLCMKHEIREMLDQGGGCIVNTASAAGLRGVANKPAYTASKHGVVGLTRAAALQYAGRGIRVNAVCPGAVDTGMLDRNLGEEKNRDLVAGNHPIQRLASPEEVADAIVWLCGDAASYVAGHALAVDGGLTV